MAENENETRKPNGQFAPGHCANPAGRPKGSRNKIEAAFLDELAAIWADQGNAMVAKVANEDPATIMRVTAGLMPRDLNVNATQRFVIQAPLPLSVEDWQAKYSNRGTLTAPVKGQRDQ